MAFPSKGNLHLRLNISLTPVFLISPRTTLTLFGSIAGFPYKNVTVLTQSGIYTQSWEASWSAWVFDFEGSVAFLGTVPRMDYLMFEVNTVLAGVYLEQLYLLEYESISGKHGFGFQWVAETDISKDVTLKLTAQFGLEENLAEKFKWQFGSGYDIVPRDDPVNLAFTFLRIEVMGFRLCDQELSLTFKFTKEKGFEYLWVDWAFALESCPLCPIRFDLDLKLEPQTKSLTLRPTIELGNGCLELYVHVEPWDLEPGSGIVDALEVKGFGCTTKELLAPFTLSVKASFDGPLYRRRGGLNDIELRAWDYAVEPTPAEAIYYEITPYHEVVSLVTGNGEYFFAVDFYFTPGLGTLFDIALVTVEGKFRLCDNLRFESGLALGNSSISALFEFFLSF